MRYLNRIVEGHLVIRGDECVTEDEMLYDKVQIEIDSAQSYLGLL